MNVKREDLINMGLSPEQIFVFEDLIQRIEALEAKKGRSQFKAPTTQEVASYMLERGCQRYDEAEKFCDFYQSKGWMVGKTKMKDWKASVRQWLKRQSSQQSLPMPTQKEQVRSSLRNIGNTDW